MLILLGRARSARLAYLSQVKQRMFWILLIAPNLSYSNLVDKTVTISLILFSMKAKAATTSSFLANFGKEESISASFFLTRSTYFW